ncbi:hypothetical protein [Paenibacillus oleatilyticus]|uniref:hypothetical protein n=1 Tax=Paenibacillus oleatilyticus TaxID=2594886 RepID=UPI001C1FAE1E|nr:hypothetical protein [Paenibacillus oleatilyticus]MBU7319417.1 hypothetical protein [Paenibacillus oleatilyticus]
MSRGVHAAEHPVMFSFIVPYPSSAVEKKRVSEEALDTTDCVEVEGFLAQLHIDVG